ncbi:AMP-binding protein [bacterium]|nr:AMP-binding protein [bacterium]
MHTIQDLVRRFESFGELTALSWKQGESTFKISYKELYHQIQNYSKGLLELGLESGDRVALLSKNIPEWIILNLAINNAGMVDVPRGKYSSPEELNFILEHSRAKVAIVEDRDFLSKLNRYKHSELHLIYTIQEIEGEYNILSLQQMGVDSSKSIPVIKGNHTAGIIYTSGTTGVPKGVELSHFNFISNVTEVIKRIDLSSDDKLLSILPAWHVFERIVKYSAVAVGAETFYTVAHTLLDDFQEQKPTILASVPRIWEMIYDRVMKKVKEKGKLERKIFDISLKAATGESHGAAFLVAPFARRLLEKKVFSELRSKLGGKFRYAVSGGSSLPPFIDVFFDAAGIEILEGYGLTETSPVISVRKPGSRALHTVGPLLENVQGKIIDFETGKELPAGEKGVLYVKGPNVMKGYYRNYEETHKVLDNDGWFDTGDLAYFDKGGNLIISGREKDIIVLSNGKNVNPIPLETELSKSDFIDIAVVTGQDWKKLGAIIVPNFEALKKYCQENEIAYSTDRIEECLEYSAIKQLYREEIKKYVNSKGEFKTYERIQEFIILPKPFEIGLELTPTLKPRRSKIEEIYKEKLSSLQSVINGRG